MFVIFGWGRVTVRDHGATVPATCSNCHNQGMQHYVHARTWFTLFFIPVIPYKSQHLLICPVCERGMKLTGEQGARAATMAETTATWTDGRITESEYLDEASAFWSEVNPPAPDPTRPSDPASPSDPPRSVDAMEDAVETPPTNIENPAP